MIHGIARNNSVLDLAETISYMVNKGYMIMNQSTVKITRLDLMRQN